MRFSADSYFCIGAAHVTAGKPCQDYALSRSTDDSACAVVSDGCSTGGHTDIGSRIMALAACNSVTGGRTSRSADEDRESIVESARDLLHVFPTDMLATCILASVDHTGAYYRVHGDGVVAVGTAYGGIEMSHFEWADNTPFYPAYSEADRQRFIQVHGDEGRYRLRSETVFEPDSNSFLIPYTVREGMQGILRRFPPQYLLDIKFIAVFSDGVAQIENVGWKDAIRELLAFKSTTGEFVKRRAMAAIRKWKESGKGPIDDFSMAVIYIDHD